MKDYLADDWQRIFEFNGLRSFDDFWKLEAQWFEEPNQRRGGWSGVARCELKRPEGGVAPIDVREVFVAWHRLGRGRTTRTGDNMGLSNVAIRGGIDKAGNRS